MSKDFVVVMALIVGGVLALAMWNWQPDPNHEKSALSRSMANDLNTAIDGFHTECGRIPDVGASDFTSDSPEGKLLLKLLFGREPEDAGMQNPRRIVFLNARVNKRRSRGGLIYSGDGSGSEPEGLYDAWGEPFEVFLASQSSQPLVFHDGTQTVTLPNRVAAVLSKGPDKIRGTKDDLRIWEPVR
jgi:hypothetical protein